jgi:hypothetical protein
LHLAFLKSFLKLTKEEARREKQQETPELKLGNLIEFDCLHPEDSFLWLSSP